jgi:hypothetical protein
MLGVTPQAANCAGAGEQEICITKVSPNAANTTGGDRIVVQGSGFPALNQTTDYVALGNLVLHYDGINNTGLGDQAHSSNTGTWKNISPKTTTKSDLDLTVQNPSGSTWVDKGYEIGASASTYFQTTSGTSSDALFADAGLGDANNSGCLQPVGGCARTFEVIFKTPSNWSSNNWNQNPWQGLAGYGVCSRDQLFGISFVGGLYNPINGCYADAKISYADAKNNFPAITQSSQLITSSFSYAGGVMNTNSKGFINGVELTATKGLAFLEGNNTLNTPSNQQFLVGARAYGDRASNAKGFTIESVRLYNKVLTPEEIDKNATIDKARFLSPPQVTVGGLPCTNITLNSTKAISCDAPAQSAGSKNVTVSYDGLEVSLPNAITYRATTVSSNTPNVGPASTSTTLTLNGTNFPYASASDYVQNGLVLQYDAIDNTGLGDRRHSNSPTTWANISPNTHGFALTKTGSASAWSSNGWNVGSVAGNYYATTDSLDGTLPSGSSARTMEVVYDTPENWTSWNGSHYGLAGYGSSSNQKMFSMSYHTTFNPLNGYYADVAIPNPSSHFPQLFQSSQPITAGFRYNGGQISDASGNIIGASGFVNGVDALYSGDLQYNGTAAVSLNTDMSRPFTVGSRTSGEGAANARGFTMHSVRLYNRALSDDELIQNYIVDKDRFLINPLSVKVGTSEGDATGCTNLTIISTTRLTCDTGATLGTGKYNIYIYYKNTLLQTLTNGYEAVGATDFYVTGSAPFEGPKFAAGQVLTITGNKMTTVDQVKVGATVCSMVSNTDTEYKCTIPAGSPGEVDITVRSTQGNKTIVLPRNFEYLDASNDPVKYRVQRSAGLAAGQYEYTLAGASSIPLPSTSICPVGYTKSGSVCNAQDATGAQGPYVEHAWTGISAVTLTYPSGLTAPATPAGWTATGPTDAQAGNKTLTLTASTLQTSEAVEHMLAGLVWTSTSGATNITGTIQAQLTNGLW